jgi:protein gp37
MSVLNKSKIEWRDRTWNPISGCLHGCPYCYAARQVQRFRPQADECPEVDSVHVAEHDARCFVEVKATVLRDAGGKYIRSTSYPKGFAPTVHRYKLHRPRMEKTPRRIFVGSMADMFGEWVPDEWLDAVFHMCREAPQHIYMFLTKNPERYTQLVLSGLLPEGDNFWYGTTATTADALYWFSTGHRTFVSIEPILGEFARSAKPFYPPPDWVIVGAMTGPGSNKHRPRPEWIEAIVRRYTGEGVPIFLKNNLLQHFRVEPFTQEYPAAMTEYIERAKEARI